MIYILNYQMKDAQNDKKLNKRRKMIYNSNYQMNYAHNDKLLDERRT